MEFKEYLKQLRISNSLTQKELSTHINLLGEEFLGIDGVSISRWERGITKPHVTRSIKILRTLTNDLLPYLLSLRIEQQENDLERIVTKRFHSPNAMLASASYNKKSNPSLLDIVPLFEINNNANTIEQLLNFLDNIGDKELKSHNVDLVGYQNDNKIFSKKLIASDTDNLQGHLLSLFFDNRKINNYYESPFLPIPTKEIIPYQENKPMALLTVTRYAETESAYWLINTLLAYLIATHANIHTLYFYVFDQMAVDYIEKIGADKVAYNTPDSHGVIKIGRQNYRFGLYRLDSANFLAQPEILKLLQDAAHHTPHFALNTTPDNKSLVEQLFDCVAIKTPKNIAT